VLAAVISITPVTLALLLVLMGHPAEPMVVAGAIHAVVKGVSASRQEEHLADGNPLSELGLVVVAMLPAVLMMCHKSAELGAHYAGGDLLITALASLVLAAVYETAVPKKSDSTDSVACSV
jgi:hypothetical protein